MRLLAITFLIFTSIGTLAQTEDCDTSTSESLKAAMKVAEVIENQTECTNPRMLRGLCGYVGDMTPDLEPQGRYRFMYQRRLLQAACVDVNKDSEEEISKKISRMWKENESKLICNNTRFDVPNGSLIKFAVNLKFDEFLIDLAKWKVNFNNIDITDNRTVLDYIDDKIKSNKGLATEAPLKRYYETLRRAGAKHKEELK